MELSSSLSFGKLAIDKSAVPDVEVRSAEITANRISGTGVKPADVDVSPEVVEKRGLSIPSGREDGANDWWRPGGRTYPSDMPEGVMKNVGIEEGDYIWQKLN